MQTAIIDSIVQSSYEKVIREDRKAKKLARWQKKDNKDWMMQYHTKGNALIVGIRSTPVMYSQLTPKEKKIYIDREIEKRKKNGKKGMWSMLDLI